MCRLFALSSGDVRVHATYWLLDAPDSMEVESRRNVDGSGLGWFDADGRPVVDKQPEPAYRDPDFVRDAVEADSTTFVGHVRWATTGVRSVENTHPFTMKGRVMAHNGGFGDLALLEAELGDAMSGVLGGTDSERYFALITRETARHGGDVAAGIASAAGWIAEHCPVSSLNTVVAVDGELWALRYPATHALHVLERPAGPGAAAAAQGVPGLVARSGTSQVHAPALHEVPSVVIASERLDGEDGWRMVGAGDLLHVARDLTVTTTTVLPDPPARTIGLPADNPNDDS
ncbi:MAG: class II glutamine amidotransferase [Candidatus Nanopelagicales bacterium]